MTRQFTHRHLVRGFLQLQDLLIYKLTLLVVDHIRVKRALIAGLIAWLLVTAAASWQGQSREATFNLDILAVIAVLAANVDDSRLGRDSRSPDHNSRDSDQV